MQLPKTDIEGHFFPFFRRRAALLSALIAFSLISPLRADDKKSTDKTTDAKVEDKEEEEESQISRSLSMLPIGKTNFGVKLPEYRNGKLSSLVIAGKLTPVERDRIFMEEVRIQTMDEEGAQDMEIRLITGSFDVTNEFLSSDDETVISRPDFTITGDSLDFDRKRGKGILRGNVKMVIRNEFFAEDKENAKKTGDSTAADEGGKKLDINAGFEKLDMGDVEVDAEAGDNQKQKDK